MLSAASQWTGLDDFGDMRWYEPCSQWLNAVIAEAPLSENGILALQQSMMLPIAIRRRVVDFAKRHPEVAREDVSDPVVVTGIVRTGTTKLQRMLANDDGVQWQCRSTAR
jgi:hypothetical protein